MKEKYRNAIIAGVCSGVTIGIISSIVRDQFSWTYLIVSTTLAPLALLIAHKLRERRGKDQLRE